METETEWIERTRHTVTKGKRNLVAEFEEKNKDRIDGAVEPENCEIVGNVHEHEERA